MKIYTKTGDAGQTDLIGERVDKDNLKISTIGTLDELNSLLGIARAKTPLQNVGEALQYLQGALFEISAIIAGTSAKDVKVPEAKNLEEVIDEVDKMLPPLTHFILPNGHEGATFLHHARSVCRRSERLVVALNKKEELAKGILEFINRTSDFLFVMARYVNHHYMIQETVWEGGVGMHPAEEEPEVAENQVTVEQAVEAVEEMESDERSEVKIDEVAKEEAPVKSQEVELPEIETVEPKAKKTTKKAKAEKVETV